MPGFRMIEGPSRMTLPVDKIIRVMVIERNMLDMLDMLDMKD